MPTFPQQPESSRYGIGVNSLARIVPYDGVADNTYAQIATLYRQANVGWVRLDFDWGRALAWDSYKSDTTNINWGDMDRAVSRAVCSGYNILGNLAYTPAWAVTRGGIPEGERYRYLPDDMNKWAEFVRAAVDRYPQIRYWSIWNEPNDTSFFRGYANGSEDDRINDYKQLIQWAAPHIRGNPTGARSLVALELAGGPAGSDHWLQRVLQEERGNIDVVAVHHYGAPIDTKNYMEGLQALAGMGDWPWDVWLTESGPIGCNSTSNPGALGYCEGTDSAYISDGWQATHLSQIMNSMDASPASARWAKTFYWHGFSEVGFVGSGGGDDYGLLAGASSGTLTSKDAFTYYAMHLAPPQVTGGTYGYNSRVTLTATPGVAGSYYYKWTQRHCHNGSAPGDCSATYVALAQGQDVSTARPLIHSQDFWVDVAVNVYAWNGGPRLGWKIWRVNGAGEGSGGGGV